MQMARPKKITFLCVTVLIVILLISIPDIASAGVLRGLMLCNNTIIPSLFPFMVCILCIMNLDISFENKYFSNFLYKVFGHNTDMFMTFIFSTLGGYPIGCKLINEMYKQNKISKSSAQIMQMYCVNAGPAFVITAIGVGNFNSKEIGVILYVSQIFASLIIALFTRKYVCKSTINRRIKVKKDLSNADNFVISVSGATGSIVGICSFVILFSAINSYIDYFFNSIPILRNAVYFTEVTAGAGKTNNVIFASFLIGFAGISIWCQIFSISKDVGINLKLFIIGRLFNGTLSAIITLIMLNIFNIKISTFSNTVIVNKEYVYTDISLSVSMFVMMIVLLVYVFSKNCSRKIIDDVI